MPPDAPTEDDLQRSPEQDPEQHRVSSANLQAAVNAVVSRHSGGSVDEARTYLTREIASRGLDPQPDRWIEAAASAAVEGHTYVVAEQAVHDTGLRLDALEDTQHGDAPL